MCSSDLLELVETRRIADPEWGLKLTGRIAGWNSGALLVHDHGGALLAGSGYSTSDDSRAARPGWFGVLRAQLPLADGANVGVIAGGHAQQEEPGAADVVREGHTWNGFAGLDAHTHLGEHWTTEAQAVVTGTSIDTLFVPVTFAAAERERRSRFGARALAGESRASTFADWMGVFRMRYRDAARSLSFGTRHVGPYFRDELSHQNYIGVTYRRLGGSWDLFPKDGPLQRFGPNFETLLIHDHTGRLEYGNLWTNLEFEFRRNAFMYVAFQHADEHWLTRAYPQERMSCFAKWSGWRTLALDANIEVGDAIWFGETATTSHLVWSENLTLNATWHPDPTLTAEANIEHLRLADRPGASDSLAVWLVGVKANAQFTRRLSVQIGRAHV